MKKILFLVLIVLVFSFLGVNKVKASGNVYGWAWSGNIGWISFNSKDCDINGNGVFEGAAEGAPTDCPTSGTAYNYGVNIETDGKFSGYAWAEHIGWISFNESELVGCPSGTCQAKLDLGTYEVSGWARALAYGGGWDGWISLGPPSYGVRVDTAATPAQFHNWAWGGNETNGDWRNKAIIGWLSFNCAEGGANGQNICNPPTLDYKVVNTFLFDQPPLTPSIKKSGENCCIPSAAGIGYVWFEWTYTDDDGDPQTGSQFQLDDNPLPDSGVDECPSCEIDHDIPGDTNTKVVTIKTTPGGGEISFRDEPYYWRVKIYNDKGESAWAYGTFNTPPHALPSPDFEWSPEKPVVNDKVEFNSASSKCYDRDNQEISCVEAGAKFTWTMPGTVGADYKYVDSTNANSPNPKVMFLTPIHEKEVKLEIEDDEGRCHLTKPLGVSLPLPKWKEIPPVSWLRNYFASLISFFF